jgi:hypothetical protein
MKYHEKKEKIRGARRRAKQLQQWKERHINALNPNVLYNFPPGQEYYYAQVSIWPWKLNPPMWYRRLMLESMIEVYDNWRRILIEGDRPFYLKIWLFDLRVYQSQIIAAVGERIERYENLFFRDPIAKTFPYDLYKRRRYDLRDFRWESRADENSYYESDMKTATQVNELRRKAHRIISCSGDACASEPTYMIRMGNIWVGERRDGS